MLDEIRQEERCERVLALLLLALGAVLRLAALGALPFGLNQDEASAGYEAFALLRAGIDRCGKSWPVLFISWGSGQNVLMSYLAMPFIALLGLNEWALRLPNAVSGCLTLLVFWRMARRAGGRRFGLLALFLLAVNPWHIMMSRWALESNLLPFFLLTGVWCTALAEDRPWALVGAAACFGLSLYAYGTAFFFLPLYLICAVIWLRRCLRPASFLTALALFAALALPIALCQLRDALGLPELTVLGVTLPRLTEGRQAATSVFGGGGLALAGENFREFLDILRRGGDGLPWNALSFWRGGIFYFFGLPTAVLGVVRSVLERKDRTAEAPMRFALLSALLCAFLIRVNINRINMIWLPLIYFSALGCDLVFRLLRRWAVVPAAGIIVCFLIFLSSYTAALGGAGNVNFFPGLGDAVRTAKATGAETVYITDRVNQPYIFALFYTETPPEDFVSSVVYQNPNGAFRRVERFSGFEFQDPDRAEVRIVYPSEAQGREVLARSGSFVICR